VLLSPSHLPLRSAPAHPRPPTRGLCTLAINLRWPHLDHTGTLLPCLPDIHDLFTEIGPLKAAMVHYNEQQKSTGTAFVVFKNPADAAKAVEAYHLVPLDGRPLKVQMVSPAGGASPMTAPARGGRQGGPTNAGPLPRTAVTLQGGRPDGGRGGRGAGRGRGGGGGRGGRGTRKEKSTPVSMEDLDADLDSYRQTKSGEDMAAE